MKVSEWIESLPVPDPLLIVAGGLAGILIIIVLVAQIFSWAVRARRNAKTAVDEFTQPLGSEGELAFIVPADRFPEASSLPNRGPAPGRSHLDADAQTGDVLGPVSKSLKAISDRLFDRTITEGNDDEVG